MRAQAQAGQAAQTGPVLVPRRRRSLVGDVWAGAMRGDFARDLGVAGALTQIVIGFLPVFGTLAALRDMLADLKYNDRAGCLFNALALVPIFGGFSKTMDVLRALHHAGHAVHVTHRAWHHDASPVPVAAPPPTWPYPPPEAPG
jgi:hypothetical protein